MLRYVMCVIVFIRSTVVPLADDDFSLRDHDFRFNVRHRLMELLGKENGCINSYLLCEQNGRRSTRLCISSQCNSCSLIQRTQHVSHIVVCFLMALGDYSITYYDHIDIKRDRLLFFVQGLDSFALD